MTDAPNPPRVAVKPPLAPMRPGRLGLARNYERAPTAAPALRGEPATAPEADK